LVDSLDNKANGFCARIAVQKLKWA